MFKISEKSEKPSKSRCLVINLFDLILMFQFGSLYLFSISVVLSSQSLPSLLFAVAHAMHILSHENWNIFRRTFYEFNEFYVFYVDSMIL